MARTVLSDAAEGDLGAVGRPACAVDRVIGDRDREQQLALGDVPDLDLAHPRGASAGDGQLLAVGRERQRLDPLGEPDQPADQLGSVGLPQQDLMEPGDGQQRAIGREVQGRDHRRPGVLGRVVHVVSGHGGLRRVVGCALGDPSADQLDLGGGERRLVLGHLGLAVLRGDLVDEEALLRLARHDRRHVALAALEHPVEGRHHVAAPGLGRLVAALALGLEDRANLLVVADLRSRGGHGRDGRILGLGLVLGLPFSSAARAATDTINRAARTPSPQLPLAMIFAISVCSPCCDLRSRRSHPALEGRCLLILLVCAHAGRVPGHSRIPGGNRPRGPSRAEGGGIHCSADARSSWSRRIRCLVRKLHAGMHRLRRQDSALLLYYSPGPGRR